LLCFDAVHRELPDATRAEKESVSEKQVQWLFAATGKEADGSELSPEEFRDCYRQLLTNAYEEEVLLLDLRRAIAALENNRERENRAQFYGKLATVADTLFAKSATVECSHPALAALFSFVSGRGGLGPKQAATAKKALDPLMKLSTVSRQQLMDAWHGLLRHDLPTEALLTAADKALKTLTAGENASSSSADSASPAAAALSVPVSAAAAAAPATQ
jgi:hypothetical protein